MRFTLILLYIKVLSVRKGESFFFFLNKNGK